MVQHAACGLSTERIQWRRILGSYIAGVGVNSVLPARTGDVVKIYLAKHSVPNSTYPAVTSSFFVESIFDITAGSIVMLFALTQGVLPSLPNLTDLPAFDLAFWAEHPRFALFTITALTIGLLVLYAVLSIRAVEFWRRVRQGLVILTDFRSYLRQVAAWQGAAWLFRFFSFYFFLEAFNIGGSVQNALLVMSVQALSTLTPFTPGGAGAQQALLVYVFRGNASRTAVLAYSVGQQIAIAAFNVAAAVAALFLLSGTHRFPQHHPARGGGAAGGRTGKRRDAKAGESASRNRACGPARRDPRGPRARASQPRGRSAGSRP